MLNLQANPRVNLTVAQDVISEVTTLLTNMSSISENSWQSTLSLAQAVSTEHRRLGLFTSEGLILPETRKVGQRTETCRVDGSIQQMQVDCEIQYIPILKTLEYILRNPLFCHEIIIKKSSDDLMRSFSDGKRHASMPIWSSKGLPIQIKLYQDDIEVANPLGANHGIYKLTQYYFSILNMPTHYHALLAHHHLVCVAMASDIKLHSHNCVTSHIVDELAELECGVLMNGVNVFGTLVALSGDNLGLNSIIGLVESFSATHYCRFCLLPKSMCQQTTSCVVANDARRTHETHAQHVEDIDVRGTGVTRGCTLDELKFFKAVDSFTPDIMHDILEGVAKLELSLVLDCLIDKKVVSLHLLNQYIDTFDYGYIDSQNHPRLLTIYSGKVAIKQSASGMWCLFRSLPVMIGESVPDSSHEWELLRLLSEITALAFRPVHSLASTKYLDFLVEEHHTLFLQIFPDKTLTPKQHNLLHYGEAIRLNGPLTQYSAMRSEAKHQLAKITSGLSCNFRNIPLTVARKYQLVSFSDWRQNRIFPNNSMERSKHDEVTSVNLNGSRFTLGSVFISEKTAYQLTSVVANEDGDPVFVGSALDAEWNPSIMAYTISEANPPIHKHITPPLSEYPFPLCIWRSTSGLRCIVPRYKITLSNTEGK